MIGDVARRSGVLGGWSVERVNSLRFAQERTSCFFDGLYRGSGFRPTAAGLLRLNWRCRPITSGGSGSRPVVDHASRGSGLPGRDRLRCRELILEGESDPVHVFGSLPLSRYQPVRRRNQRSATKPCAFWNARRVGTLGIGGCSDRSVKKPATAATTALTASESTPRLSG